MQYDRGRATGAWLLIGVGVVEVALVVAGIVLAS
jgi:hypothetical protein